MKYQYLTEGTCSKMIEIIVEEGVINNVSFVGGCNGNLQGISALVKGQTPEAVIERINGIRCGSKPTSCPDQLAKALMSICEENKKQ